MSSVAKITNSQSEMKDITPKMEQIDKDKSMQSGESAESGES